MAVYRDANTIIKQIIDFVQENNDLKKLLYYNENPLDPTKPIPAFSEMMLKNIYPMVNSVEVESDAKSFISIYLWNGNSASTMQYKDIEIHIDVISHISLWRLDSGDIRPLLIMDEIDSKLPFYKINAIRNNALPTKSNFISYNEKFMGYKLIYKITNRTFDCR